MRKRMIPALVLSLLAAAGAVAAETKEPSISVTGTSVMRVAPDTIVWRMTVSDEDKDMAAAKVRNDKRMNQLMEVVRSFGFPSEDVATSHLSIRKEYFRDEKGQVQGFKHWAVTRTVSVRQSGLDRFDACFEAFTDVGELELSYSLENSRLTELRWENRRKAVQLAKEKATGMLAELGAELGPPLRVEEHRDRPGPEMHFSNAAVAVGNGNNSADAATGTFAPGQIELSTTVHVTFGIE